MSGKRFKDQILFTILETCQKKNTSKTGIVYAAGINFNTIGPYLSLLTEKGLLEIMEGSPTLYRITPKGLDALEHIRALEWLIFARNQCYVALAYWAWLITYLSLKLFRSIPN